MSQRNQMQNLNEQKILPVACLRTFFFFKGISLSLHNYQWKKKRHLLLKTVGCVHSEKLETVYNFLIKVKMGKLKKNIKAVKGICWLFSVLDDPPFRDKTFEKSGTSHCVLIVFTKP